MSYNYITELVHLPACPKNERETRHKMMCLQELGNYYNNEKSLFYTCKRSKRYTRLLRMFWAFKHMKTIEED